MYGEGILLFTKAVTAAYYSSQIRLLKGAASLR